MVADALTVRWSDEATDEAGAQVDAWLERYGEAFVGPALDRAAPGERQFGEGMMALSDRLDTPHDFAMGFRYAYFWAEGEP